MIWTQGFLTLNGQDVSAQIVEVKIETNFVEVENPALNDTARKTETGIADEVFSCTLRHNGWNGNVHTTLQSAKGGDLAWVFRPTSAVKSPTNPEWSATYTLTKYNPISAKPNEKAVTTITPKSKGAAITYATA